eukprot:1103272_1
MVLDMRVTEDLWSVPRCPRHVGQRHRLSLCTPALIEKAGRGSACGHVHVRKAPDVDRFVPNVNARILVALQAGRLCKTLATEAALERFLTRVNSFVNLQI